MSERLLLNIPVDTFTGQMHFTLITDKYKMPYTVCPIFVTMLRVVQPPGEIADSKGGFYSGASCFEAWLAPLSRCSFTACAEAAVVVELLFGSAPSLCEEHLHSPLHGPVIVTAGFTMEKLMVNRLY